MSDNVAVDKAINSDMKKENIIGFGLILFALTIGGKMLPSSILFFRLLMGIGLGYALTRSAMGFAGSVNRAYNTGSTKLMKTLMLMFLATAIINVGFVFADPTSYNLWVNPINFGLILGGLFFGFGMTFSSCCASGVLTDLVTGLPRALVTLVFFGMGVFLGFPVQSSAPWVRKSLFTSQTGAKFSGGVYLPDLFKGDGLNGYIGAVLLTALFAGIVVYISSKYEKGRKEKNCYTGVCSEIEQEEAQNKEYSFYGKLFVKPWSMEMGAAVITGICAMLMGVTKAGWGASTPYGFWFGKLLMRFGVSAESLSEFTTKPTKVFTMPFFNHQINVQNFGIILGTIIALALAGNLVKMFKSELKISAKDACLFAMGGLFMGLGTRFANGCNVGALYTPIANFSLSGWIFLAFLILGGIGGNILGKKIKS